MGKLDRGALAALRQELCAAFAAGRISEADLERELRAVDRHQLAPRAQSNGRAPGQTPAMQPTLCRQLAREPGHAPAARLPFPRAPQRRQDPEKRRRWAASGWLPPALAAQFTAGELAALSVVAAQVQARGACYLSHDRLAAAAGVSASTARNALREARRLGLVSAEERRASPYRHRPNVVRVISREWRAWLDRRSGQGVKNLPAVSTVQDSKGFSGRGVAPAGAPGLDSHSPAGPGKWRSANRTRKTRSV